MGGEVVLIFGILCINVILSVKVFGTTLTTVHMEDTVNKQTNIAILEEKVVKNLYWQGPG